MEDYLEQIEKSNFMTNLKLGTPEQSLPFQIEMGLKDTCVVNKKFDDKRVHLGDDKSKNLQTN
jgi:hypothetical protein